MQQLLAFPRRSWFTVVQPFLRVPLRYPYTAAALCLLVGTAVIFSTRQWSDWDQHYLPAAARLAQGDNIYRGGFVYPPINAWLVLPFVGLPHLANRLLWYAVSVVGLFVLVRGSWRLAGGGRLEGLPAVPRAEHAIYCLGLLCGFFYALDVLTNQQTDLVVAGLVIAGCLALTHQQDWRSGVLFGLAAGIKCTPLLWAPYLAWRRRWVAAVLVPVVAVGVNFLPDLTHPSATGVSRLGAWANQYLRPMTHARHEFGTWAAAVNFNFSLAGASKRWLTYEPTFTNGEILGVPRPERPSAALLRAAGLGSMALFVLVSLGCAVRARRTEPEANSAPSVQTLEFSLVLILMLLLSPHSSKPHFCTLLLPGFCVARAAIGGRDWRFLVLLLPALALTTLMHKDLLGKFAYGYGMWYAGPTLVAVLLLTGCCLALLRRPKGENEVM
ncbi:MAG: DUF2029 domain-containing protein, partial [Planctomycetia bacterium]|nr:DUF2029 domain-containing protein [Planctomycetia bacterium]